MNKFKVGDKVICIKTVYHSFGGPFDGYYFIEKGRIYTVKNIHKLSDNINKIFLKESNHDWPEEVFKLHYITEFNNELEKLVNE